MIGLSTSLVIGVPYIPFCCHCFMLCPAQRALLLLATLEVCNKATTTSVYCALQLKQGPSESFPLRWTQLRAVHRLVLQNVASHCSHGPYHYSFSLGDPMIFNKQKEPWHPLKP